MTLKRLLLTVGMCCLVATANAAPIDDAEAAYNRGDYAQTLKILRTLVAQGNVEAQFSIGGMYSEGKGVTQSYQEALKWFRLAAAQGHAGAQNNIGSRYLNGQGVTQNYQEALKWYRLAAAQGQENAIENLKLPDMISTAQQYQQTYQSTPQPKSESKTDMTSAMGKCSELGFKKGTEKFGDCVLKLSK
jgi:TPR repeat protein